MLESDKPEGRVVGVSEDGIPEGSLGEASASPCEVVCKPARSEAQVSSRHVPSKGVVQERVELPDGLPVGAESRRWCNASGARRPHRSSRLQSQRETNAENCYAN